MRTCYRNLHTSCPFRQKGWSMNPTCWATVACTVWRETFEVENFCGLVRSEHLRRKLSRILNQSWVGMAHPKLRGENFHEWLSNHRAGLGVNIMYLDSLESLIHTCIWHIMINLHTSLAGLTCSHRRTLVSKITYFSTFSLWWTFFSSLVAFLELGWISFCHCLCGFRDDFFSFGYRCNQSNSQCVHYLRYHDVITALKCMYMF